MSDSKILIEDVSEDIFKDNINSDINSDINGDINSDINTDLVLDQNSDLDQNENNIETEHVIGIDLGTINSCVAIWRNNNLEIIPDEKGNRTIPSVVAFTNRSKYVSYEAKNQIELNPKNVFYEVKRLIGRKINDNTVINDMQFFSYDIGHDEEDNIILKSDLVNRKKIYTPEEISAMVLMKLKEMASEYLKSPVYKAVITVPAYFNDSQRQATKDAAKIAGLECLKILNEPTSAALAYGLEQISSKTELTVIVYDLGGGTLDASLLTIADGVFEVMASSGNSHLGGVDFDNRMIGYCISQFKKKNNTEHLTDLSAVSLQRLKRACENSKKILSEVQNTVIAVRDFYNNQDLYVKMSRTKLYDICKDLLILCIKPLEDVLNSCDMKKSDINEIIMVGGATRMPAIRDNIKLFFGGKEPNCSVNPDEVVAAGAAIQAYILEHKSDPFSASVVLLDVAPLSLGVETVGGIMNVLIPRNSQIPITVKKKYTTTSDYETSVSVMIYEGERKMTKDNYLVGKFDLNGLESMPRGFAEIMVTIKIDTNGIISVTAEDMKNSDVKNGITITGNKGRLSQDQIKKLVEEARDSELKDKAEREKKQLHYEVDDLIANIKSNIDNPEFKLGTEDIKIVDSDIQAIKIWLNEKKYNDRAKDEYKKILSKLKKRYGTLILKVTNDNANIKASDKISDKLDPLATSVYDDDDEDQTLFEQIENDESGIGKDASLAEKQEIKEIRAMLVDLCNSIFDVVTSTSCSLDTDHKAELKDFVDDTLLWAHIQQKVIRNDYKNKIDEVNAVCDKIFDSYKKENKFLFDSTTTKKDELEQLCYAIKSSIECNLFSLHEDKMKELMKKIDDMLEWILDISLKQHESSLAEESEKPKEPAIIISEEMYQTRIDEINSLCNKLYDSMLQINISGSDANTVQNIVDLELKNINANPIIKSNILNCDESIHIPELMDNDENEGTTLDSLA